MENQFIKEKYSINNWYSKSRTAKFSLVPYANEMARAIVLTSEQWFLLSGTENNDGRLIINLKEMPKTPGLNQSKETSTIYFFKQFTYVLPIVCRSG
jgi:hypothetical protein